VIRELTGDDVERVGAIWLSASLQAHDFVPAAFWRSDHAVMVGEILPKARGFLHQSGPKVDGFITVRNGTVFCLFVDPPDQGRGIGGKLLEHAKARNASLRLTVYQQNAGAQRFYARHGFRAVGSSTCGHTGCPEVIMQWTAED
jgi:putative acetyltransferase